MQKTESCRSTNFVFDGLRYFLFVWCLFACPYDTLIVTARNMFRFILKTMPSGSGFLLLKIWWLRKKSNFFVALHLSSMRRTIYTPYSSRFARLELELFALPSHFRFFTGSSKFHIIYFSACHWGKEWGKEWGMETFVQNVLYYSEKLREKVNNGE